ERADRGLPVAGAEEGGRGRGQGGHRLLPHLGRPAPDPPVGRPQLLWQDQGAGGLMERSGSPPIDRVGFGHAATLSSPDNPQCLMEASPVSRISRRVAAIAESATLAVDAKTNPLKGAGGDVIGFGAGGPHFPTPKQIVGAAVAACQQPRYHHYTPGPGLPELRAAIAAKTARDSGLTVQPAQVLVTKRGQHALYEAFPTLLDPGDEVLLPAPYWVSYPEAISLTGAEPVIVETDKATGFRVSVEQLEAAT